MQDGSSSPTSLGVTVEPLADGGGEVAAPVEPVFGSFGQGSVEHVVEMRQIRAVIAQSGRVLV